MTRDQVKPWPIIEERPRKRQKLVTPPSAKNEDNLLSIIHLKKRSMHKDANILRKNRLTPMKSVIAARIMLAHSWYPGSCCHDQDCHPVRATT